MAMKGTRKVCVCMSSLWCLYAVFVDFRNSVQVVILIGLVISGWIFFLIWFASFIK